MGVTLNDAMTAMTAVLQKYESNLDEFVVAVVKTMPPVKIYQILPQSQYTPYFNLVFKNFFAPINVVALSAPSQKMRMIHLARNATDAAPAIACPAFTAPAVNVWDRVIYVNADADIKIGTLYHEFVHFLEHGNFYPEYYSRGGDGPRILEGVTEYLTREVDPAIKTEREQGDKYGAFLRTTLERAWGNPTERLAKMIRVAFQGDISSLPS
ncbi:MAG TPA: hypothetical protein VG204_09180 [Terriglobia bacterium]|nr:hypothetical protein [Terriglobia bacterium]